MGASQIGTGLWVRDLAACTATAELSADRGSLWAWGPPCSALPPTPASVQSSARANACALNLRPGSFHPRRQQPGRGFAAASVRLIRGYMVTACKAGASHKKKKKKRARNKMPLRNGPWAEVKSLPQMSSVPGAWVGVGSGGPRPGAILLPQTFPSRLANFILRPRSWSLDLTSSHEEVVHPAAQWPPNPIPNLSLLCPTQGVRAIATHPLLSQTHTA